MQGSLVLTWLFINSLQLIAHVPLIAARLPANANIMLGRLLGFTRLNIDALSEALDTPESVISTNQLANDEDSYFSPRMLQSGYRVSFARNLLFGLIIALFASVAWAATAAVSKFYKPHKRTRASRSAEVFMANFMTRFALEAFFELMVCSMINLTSMEAGGFFWWFVSLATLCAGLVAMIFVVLLYFKNGPYL